MPHTVHIENYDADTENNIDDMDETTDFPAATGATTNINIDMAEYPRPPTRRGRTTSLHSLRFYGRENMERVRRHMENTRLRRLDYEPNPRTFRVLATREYDLWVKQDFTAAVQLLAALQMYLLSGEAKCGAIQELFEKHPINRADEEDEEDEGSDSDSNYLFAAVHSEEERGTLMREHVDKEERRITEHEEKLRREQVARWTEEDRAASVSEELRVEGGDGISSLREARKPWWECVWDGQEGTLRGDTDEDEEMIVGNVM